MKIVALILFTLAVNADEAGERYMRFIQSVARANPGRSLTNFTLLETNGVARPKVSIMVSNVVAPVLKPGMTVTVRNGTATVATGIPFNPTLPQVYTIRR